MGIGAAIAEQLARDAMTVLISDINLEEAEKTARRFRDEGLSAHALCWTDQMFEGIGAIDVQAVLELSRGQAPAGIVNRAVLDNPIWQQRLARYKTSKP